MVSKRRRRFKGDPDRRISGRLIRRYVRGTRPGVGNQLLKRSGRYKKENIEVQKEKHIIIGLFIFILKT